MSYRKLDLVQGSPEWLAKRFEHFTASRAGCIDNVYPYQTALEYATELLSKQAKDESKGKEFIFAHGHEVEKAAREWVKSNLKIELAPSVVVSNKLPCLLASLDGIDESRGLIFEAKYVGSDALEDVKRGKLKPHHEYQLQAQLLTTGYEKAIYFAMDPKGNAAVMDVLVDHDLQFRLTEGIAKFWTDLQAGKLPEACHRDILKVENDPQLSMLADLDSQINAIQSQYDELKKEILARYNKAFRVQGGRVSIVRFWEKGRVDYDEIPQLRGVNLDAFRKSGMMKTKVTIKKGA